MESREPTRRNVSLGTASRTGGDDSGLKIAAKSLSLTNPISRWGLFSLPLNLGWPWDYLTNWNNHHSGCDTMLVLGLDLKRTSNFCFLPTECFLLRSIYDEKKSKLANRKDHLGRQRHQPPSWPSQGTRYRSKAILAFLVPAPHDCRLTSTLGRTHRTAQPARVKNNAWLLF